VLHPVLVRQPYVEDADAVGRGLRDGRDDALHHRVVGVELAHVVAEYRLRARHVLPVRPARVEVEALGSLLREGRGAEGGEEEQQRECRVRAGILRHGFWKVFSFGRVCVKDSGILTRRARLTQAARGRRFY
jgi:hypothetical protein